MATSSNARSGGSSAGPTAAAAPPRVDLEVVAELVPAGARVLDLGCGDGTLLRLLVDHKGVVARGVEISEEGVRQCVAKGLAVHHADLDEGLGDYPDGSFDCVILSQTLQTVHKPDLVLKEMLRVGRFGIVSFPNFGHWHVRWLLAAGGRMPVDHYIPYQWYDTPNIHFLTVADFHGFCAGQGIKISQAVYLSDGHRVGLWPNLRARTAIFVVHR